MSLNPPPSPKQGQVWVAIRSMPTGTSGTAGSGLIAG